MSEKNSTYYKRGVSYSKSDIHEAISGLDKGLYPNAFCKILPDIAAGDPQYCNVVHADTAGTKTSLAYLYWKETGDLSVWEGIVQDAIVMNLDDMACSGFINDIMLSSTVGRNKHLIPKEVITRIIRSGFEFIEKMKQFDISLFHAGGETADVGDIVRTVDVGYTAFGRLDRGRVINNAIRSGDLIVGLASYGQASYEDDYNGGMGSNGLTSARHDVFHHSYREKYPETFDPATEKELVYSGSRKVDETIAIGDVSISLGKLVLSPTRTYLPIIKPIIESHHDKISGLIHCTGGAQTKVLHFLDEPAHVIKDDLFPIPPLFSLIQEESGSSRKEMYPIFNMGHRMEIYVKTESVARSIIELSQSFDVDARIIGRVEAADRSMVTIEDTEGSYSFD
ncbi:MAG: phosphoribosylformylglycinamidine cyclo-ligase [Saprospiraceae bacterium]|nr:phosphoribosylformylglycinamidine cyclo-ligase [Saprospiraceae bacterium]